MNREYKSSQKALRIRLNYYRNTTAYHENGELRQLERYLIHDFFPLQNFLTPSLISPTTDKTLKLERLSVVSPYCWMYKSTVLNYHTE